MVQAEVDLCILLQEFFDPEPIRSDSVQVELNPKRTLQVLDLELRARFPILNTLTLPLNLEILLTFIASNQGRGMMADGVALARWFSSFINWLARGSALRFSNQAVPTQL